MVKQPTCQTPYSEFSKCITREVQGDDRYSWWKKLALSFSFVTRDNSSNKK